MPANLSLSGDERERRMSPRVHGDGRSDRTQQDTPGISGDMVGESF